MRHERPLNGGDRSSALWGRGGRETRSSALWGRGGRSAVAFLTLLVSVVIPAAGIAGDSQPRALVPGELISAAQANENATFKVIVQGDPRGNSKDLADGVRNDLSSGSGDGSSKFKRYFKSIDGVAVEITGKELLKLSQHPLVLSITRDATMSVVGNGDWEVTDPADAGMWRQTVGAPALWDQPAIKCALSLLGLKLDPSCIDKPAVSAPQAPAIAIVDTGIDSSRAGDFGSRIIARANFSSIEPNVSGDPSGHGTMVAGVAAGNGSMYPGVARNAPLVDVRVASSQGEARTSDVVAAVDWMIANKNTYNIRVANFSLVGTSNASFRVDPLDKAVEKLWFNGIVVVAAAGNNGSPSNPVGIGSPANDPFVITVGAVDINGTTSISDDTRAPWSAYGPTADGFMKPDVSAPGRWIVAPVPQSSVFVTKKANRVVAPGYMWMSGTSFSAPMVAGAAAQILARRPGLSPDQVKGALMLTASYVRAADPGAGVGEIDAAAAAAVSSPPNPNENLNQFVSGGVFDETAWSAFVKANSNWTQSNWTASNWVSSNWTASNWVSSNWTASNWVSSNWTASNWTQSNWTVSTDEE
jgi:serine protease AprX